MEIFKNNFEAVRFIAAFYCMLFLSVVLSSQSTQLIQGDYSNCNREDLEECLDIDISIWHHELESTFYKKQINLNVIKECYEDYSLQIKYRRSATAENLCNCRPSEIKLYSHNNIIASEELLAKFGRTLKIPIPLIFEELFYSSLEDIGGELDVKVKVNWICGENQDKNRVLFGQDKSTDQTVLDYSIMFISEDDAQSISYVLCDDNLFAPLTEVPCAKVHSEKKPDWMNNQEISIDIKTNFDQVLIPTETGARLQNSFKYNLKSKPVEYIWEDTIFGIYVEDQIKTAGPSFKSNMEKLEIPPGDYPMIEFVTIMKEVVCSEYIMTCGEIELLTSDTHYVPALNHQRCYPKQSPR